MTLESELNGVARTLRQLVGSTAPGSMSGDQARSLVATFAEIERLGGSGVALLTPRVIETGSYAKEGFASAPDWLGAVSGSSAGVANSRLAAAERAASSPELSEALQAGRLSSSQLKIVTDTAAVDPAASGELLSLLNAHVSIKELRDTATRKRAEARSKECERVQRARVHAHRHLRWHQVDGGGIRGDFFCDEVEWAKVEPVLEADTKARWKAAGAASGESLEAHRLDAFIALVSGARQGGTNGARDRAVVIIDAEALRRGTTEHDEVCEVEGIGPVSVEAATELIGEAGVQFVIRDGIDIRTVTGTTRGIRDRVNTALLVRDRNCVVPHCGKRLGLERDHCRIDYKDDGPAELSNLARLCAACHDMKTNGGWKLGGGPGHWTWDAPPNPPSAGAIKRTRKVTTAKAKARAGAGADRNFPLQD